MTSYIGKGVDRVDGPAKTTGKAQYAAEFPYDGIAHAALTYATVARGRIIAINTAVACAIPGVIAVFTHLNAPTMQRPPKPNPMNLASRSGTRHGFGALAQCARSGSATWSSPASDPE
jgi:xanthine dehydrogenase YagR molybdenum-binding subunit